MPTKRFENISLSDLQVTSSIAGSTDWRLSIEQDDSGIVRAEVTHADIVFLVLTQSGATAVTATGEDVTVLIPRAWIS
jgi:hypothetical protein